MLVADYTLIDFFWSMFVVFIWILWFWLLFTVWFDIFRRDDISGWSKALWLIFTIVLPFLGVFVYLIANNDGMTQRTVSDMQKQQVQMDDYVRSVASSSSPAAEIEKAQALLDSGAISQSEYEALKAKAIAT